MSLQGLLQQVAACQPGLTGRVGTPGASQLVAGGSPAPLADLLDYWRRAQPEAGPLYWASRSWTMLIWQPLYLLVWAAHRCRAVPRLASLAQCVQGGVVSGFVLEAHRPLAYALPEESLAAAGAEASLICRQLLADLSAQIRLHPKMAGRLQADCLLSALLAVARSQPDFAPERVRQWADAWLAATGLAEQSGLCQFDLPDGGQGLGLARRVCCQHFRRADGELCGSCPKLSAEQRTARLREEWLC
ncbi:siderophore ferric iron reductase [Paludibacterium purpuratum]|uniref:Siderophore ferric iron reductase n=1 Tax=Paludibacterium purpuratum TaxID=1144873 RepID=A0A4R7BF03_9NEIS|nr:siderophore ferric iron reductase [Paludibacterium purpuratum]TDR82852.1 siderophore ferric iron reductase [Paludibacterium purpuratum]